MITGTQTSLQCDADRRTHRARPTQRSAFVIGCCALLTCLLFTSLQQLVVNHSLLLPSGFIPWLCLLCTGRIFMSPSLVHHSLDHGTVVSTVDFPMSLTQLQLDLKLISLIPNRFMHSCLSLLWSVNEFPLQALDGALFLCS